MQPPDAAVDAAEATLRGILDPWLKAEVHGSTLGSQLRIAAVVVLRDVEAAWPHPDPEWKEQSCTAAATQVNTADPPKHYRDARITRPYAGGIGFTGDPR
jgi:hypothetical protein